MTRGNRLEEVLGTGTRGKPMNLQNMPKAIRRAVVGADKGKVSKPPESVPYNGAESGIIVRQHNYIWHYVSWIYH